MLFALRGCAITLVLCDMEKYHHSSKWIRQYTFSIGIELLSVLGIWWFYTDTQFTSQPSITNLSDQAVEYGRIATFECHVLGCHDTFTMRVNKKIIIPYDLLNLSAILHDSREYSKTTNYHNETDQLVATFWFVVNNETIENVKSIQCECVGIPTQTAYLIPIYPKFNTAGDNCSSLLKQCMERPTNCSGATNKNELSLSYILLLLLIVITCLFVWVHQCISISTKPSDFSFIY